MTPPRQTDARFGVRPTDSDSTPAVFLSGPVKFIYPHVNNDGYSFENCTFTRAMLAQRETLRRSLERSRENPMHRQARKNMAIAMKLKELNRAEVVEQKRREQLHQNSTELRELSEHLKLAAISKDLNERMIDFYKSPLQVERAKADVRRQAEVERQEYLIEVRQKELAKKDQQRCLRESLALQIKENQQRRKQESLQTLADREHRKALQQQIEEEDKAKQIHQKQQKILKHQEMKRSIEEKYANRELHNKQEENELRKHLKTHTQLDERKKKLDQKRLEIKRKQEEISAQLGRQIYKLETDKYQRDSLLLDLLESEYSAKGEERLRQELHQDKMLRKQTKEELDAYRRKVFHHEMENKERKRQEIAERKADSVIKQDEIAKEQRLAEHQKRKDHGAVLLSMIKDNQRKRAEAMAENVQLSNMKAKAEKELQQRIQRERFEMLHKVPASVLRYLPNHVLSDADRKRFGVEQRKKMGAGDA